ncbi:hypothetical protein CEV31_0948 [Brucella thiophenivorans]|uniref:Uncharacterized protein n=1 Tax=Brucella thiophenivorans TaxID=571255 RepID=A0A256G0N4_9HYPH|nr:hypothetical protein CEV31_0948 [Brucella thiophenivorans]
MICIFSFADDQAKEIRCFPVKAAETDISGSFEFSIRKYHDTMIN